MYNFGIDVYATSHLGTVGLRAPIPQDMQAGSCWGLRLHLQPTGNGGIPHEPCIPTHLLQTENSLILQNQGIEYTLKSVSPPIPLVDALHDNAPATSDYQSLPPPPVVPAPKRKFNTEISDDDDYRPPKLLRLAKSKHANGKGKRLHPCEKCPDFVAGSTGDLNRHYESLVHKPTRSHICNIASCGRSFTRVDALKRHMKNLHQPGQRARKTRKAVTLEGN